MTLTTSHRPPLVEEITAKLRELIHSGEWPLQQRIPAEPELMAVLGISRGTLREAIKALAHSGMLEVRRGDGTYVRATSEISGAAQRMYRDHSQVHILEVRVGLDTQAARLAARHATADDVEAMRALLEARRVAWLAEDYAGWARADWDFHVLVAQASGNPLLHELYVSFGVRLPRRPAPAAGPCRLQRPPARRPRRARRRHRRARRNGRRRERPPEPELLRGVDPAVAAPRRRPPRATPRPPHRNPGAGALVARWCRG